MADTAEAKPGVAASTGGPEGISAAATTAAAVTRASTYFFINVLWTGRGSVVGRMRASRTHPADTSAV
ncbi:hypothetical protein GCM10009743_39620 [Kribbella swartbergensis]